MSVTIFLMICNSCIIYIALKMALSLVSVTWLRFHEPFLNIQLLSSDLQQQIIFKCCKESLQILKLKLFQYNFSTIYRTLKSFSLRPGSVEADFTLKFRELTYNHTLKLQEALFNRSFGNMTIGEVFWDFSPHSMQHLQISNC